MMKTRRIGKKLLVMTALLLFSAFTIAVCAEEGGYWTTCTDSEGRVVRVFTYTEPVEYTLGEGDPDQPLDQPDEPDEPVAGVDEAPVHLAAPAGQEMADTTAAAAPSHPLAGVTVLGVVMLAVLAAALYKAV